MASALIIILYTQSIIVFNIDKVYFVLRFVTQLRAQNQIINKDKGNSYRNVQLVFSSFCQHQRIHWVWIILYALNSPLVPNGLVQFNHKFYQKLILHFKRFISIGTRQSCVFVGASRLRFEFKKSWNIIDWSKYQDWQYVSHALDVVFHTEKWCAYGNVPKMK